PTLTVAHHELRGQVRKSARQEPSELGAVEDAEPELHPVPPPGLHLAPTLGRAEADEVLGIPDPPLPAASAATPTHDPRLVERERGDRPGERAPALGDALDLD